MLATAAGCGGRGAAQLLLARALDVAGPANATAVDRSVRCDSTPPTGIVSIASNVMLTCGARADVPCAGCRRERRSPSDSASAANFLAADRWVFVTDGSRTGLAGRRAHRRACAALRLLARRSMRGTPTCATVESSGVAGRPARVRRHEPTRKAKSIGVPGGTIHQWTGCTVVHARPSTPSSTRSLRAGTPPPQEDVLEARLLRRQRRLAARVPEARPPDDRDRHLRHRTRHGVSATLGDTGDEPQRRHAHRAGRRRRSRISLAAELVLAVHPGRYRTSASSCVSLSSAGRCRCW